MECREFRTLLAPYVEGRLPEPDFGRMVAHEATCAVCHARAAAAMRDPAYATADEAWTAQVLQRTSGADCRSIAMRLAAEIETPLAADEREVVARHLNACADCRALARALRHLPALYHDVPRLRADRAFTRGVLRRTLPRRPGLLAFLRTFWRRPELLWEGAVLCSLLMTPILGQPLLDLLDRIEQRPPWQEASLQVGRLGSEQLTTLRARAIEAGVWVTGAIGRVRAQLETPDSPAGAAGQDSLAAPAAEGGTRHELRDP